MKKQIILFSLIGLIWTGQSQAQVTAEFNASDTIVCADGTTIFTYTGNGANLYHWNFGDGGVTQTTTNTTVNKAFRTPGTYLVQLIATNGSMLDTTTKFIRVKPKLATSFNLSESSNNGFYCLGTSLSISQWSNIQGFDSIIWDFGDGYKSYKRYPKHTYTTPGQYEIKLSLKGFCGVDENTLTVDIVTDDRGKPQVGLNAYPNVGLSNGDIKR